MSVGKDSKKEEKEERPVLDVNKKNRFEIIEEQMESQRIELH